MKISETTFEGLLVIAPSVFEDDRGYFFESYNKKVFQSSSIEFEFVQDNISCSQKGVLRGLHFQNPPWEQGKLVRVLRGSVLDVVVDLRKKSPRYGSHFSIELNEKNKTMLFIPPGFAHGFLTKEDQTLFSYKCTNYYHRESERCLIWNDPNLGIDWGIMDPLLSDKDKSGIPFKSFNSLF